VTDDRQMDKVRKMCSYKKQKLEKYVSPVPTYYAAVHLALHNPNLNPNRLTWELAHEILQLWGTFTPIMVFLLTHSLLHVTGCGS